MACKIRIDLNALQLRCLLPTAMVARVGVEPTTFLRKPPYERGALTALLTRHDIWGGGVVYVDAYPAER